MLHITSIDDDFVIDSKFITGKTNYDFALKSLYPLINHLPIQRNLQNPTFYSRLKSDILKGCVMPPITLAFIADKDVLPTKQKEAEEYINKNIQNGFILDGIQRISTLKRAYDEPEENLTLNLGRPLFINVIICKSPDNLLYRMITLNNGQKPMSANHQIEILLGNIYEFKELEIVIQTEKERGKKGKYAHAFEKANIIKSYLAFLANSTAIDNKKIIEDKLDELVAKKILESKRTVGDLEYNSVIGLINRLSESKYNKEWFDNANNIIGFSVGIRKSFKEVSEHSTADFEKSLKEFEKAFTALKLSTIKLSKERRNLSEYFIASYATLRDKHELDLLDVLNEKVL
jgi:hypothetical protein